MQPSGDYEIGHAHPDEVSSLGAIEKAAAALLDGKAPEAVLRETTGLEELVEAQQQGRLWVARQDGHAVGFALVTLPHTGSAHLHEIDVLPSHGRRGLGRRLVLAVCEWAARSGYRDVTLTTFRDVPWNMPFYASLGFEELPVASWTPALREIVDDETARGLDPANRVVMRYPIDG
jgi:GNAT superfamily N-acetyltransferase